MTILVIDGQGGGLGREMVLSIKKEGIDCTLIAVGTNTSATEAMLKAGADKGATGENPVVVLSRDADIIVGPIGIVIADSMMGEITERMASSISRSKAKRVLIPLSLCDTFIAGNEDVTLTKSVRSAVQIIKSIASQKSGN